jgi:hypothetical protein
MTEPILNAPTRFRGPNSGIVATVFVVLFFASLMPVTALGGTPYFPGPTASVNEIVAFFSQRQGGTQCTFPELQHLETRIGDFPLIEWECRI